MRLASTRDATPAAGERTSETRRMELLPRAGSPSLAVRARRPVQRRMGTVIVRRGDERGELTVWLLREHVEGRLLGLARELDRLIPDLYVYLRLIGWRRGAFDTALRASRGLVQSVY